LQANIVAHERIGLDDLCTLYRGRVPTRRLQPLEVALQTDPNVCAICAEEEFLS
jgi:hypothetical protein